MPGCQRGAESALAPLTPDQVREPTFLLIGTIDEIAKVLRMRRADLGISSVVVFPHDMDICLGRGSSDRWRTAVPLSLRTEEGRVPGAFWTRRGGGRGVAP